MRYKDTLLFDDEKLKREDVKYVCNSVQYTAFLICLLLTTILFNISMKSVQ